MPHLFVDISAHGFGHLAQVAPVLRALAPRLPGLTLTVRSALPEARLRERIGLPLRHIGGASDFGFHMLDALRLDHAANIRAYRAFHADWQRRVAAEAGWLAALAPDFVFTDVAYLPLAAAARCAIPAAAMSSLNWADLFAHFYGDAPWAPPVLAEMRDAYASATFLRPEPGLAMDWLPRRVGCGTIAASGVRRRDELCARLGIAPDARIVAVALGGIPARLPVERWLGRADIVWLVPASWQLGHPRCRTIEAAGWMFTDLLASIDAVFTKPGYGTFAEAAANATPTAYLRRPDWPEQEPLIAWLHRVVPALEVPPEALAGDAVGACLDRLWAQPARPPPATTGADDAAAWLAAQLAQPG